MAAQDTDRKGAGVMRLNLSIVQACRDDAEKQINAHYSSLARVTMQQDAEHHIKRVTAHAVLAGQPASVEFISAAAIEGLTVAGMAADIVARPDDTMARANVRRALILKVRSGATPEQIAALLKDAGIYTEATGALKNAG